MIRHLLLLFMTFLLCHGCINCSNNRLCNTTVPECSYDNFTSFRNFTSKSIEIQGLPEKDENVPQVIDVLRESTEQMTQLDISVGNSIGRLLMPNLWDKTRYYCSGKINLVDGLDSFIIYVPNYRETGCPSSYLINMKGGRLVALLILSSYAVGSSDTYAHLYTQYCDGIFTAYYKDIEIEEITETADNSLDEDFHQSLASFVFNPSSYRIITQTKIDKNGYFYSVTN